MLADKDRIFTNLYGSHGAGPEVRDEARRVGSTKLLIEQGRDWIIDEMKARACAAAAAPDFRPA